MAGLALKLAPGEQVMINGVVVENGPRRTQIVIRTADAAVLRMREALDESDVVGPVSEAYYAAQGGVSGLVPACEASERCSAALERSPLNEERETIATLIEGAQFYRVMRALRPFLADERGLQDGNLGLVKEEACVSSRAG